MIVKRVLEPEILDSLAEDDPQAIHSRSDLILINRIMGSSTILTSAMQQSVRQPLRILELGAGDGTLMLAITKKLAKKWPGVELTLLDRLDVVSHSTRKQIRELGWKVKVLNADVLAWAQSQPTTDEHWDIVTANLFIHHFSESDIRTLFKALSQRTRMFIACEPRRSKLALSATRLLGLIGANAVTKNDAELSVKAGFTAQELSSLWQQSCNGDWQLTEKSARLFSHVFIGKLNP